MIMEQTVTGVAEGLIYHIFPLGMQGASRSNFEQVVRGRNIKSFVSWIPHLKRLGVSAVLFGPILHSTSHGYDSIDLYKLDPRLGSNEDFAELSRALHDEGIAVIMDAVCNHSGRDFFAFRDLLKRREDSPYRHWYMDVDFSMPGPAGDGFSYACWDGHPSLPKFNLSNPEVRDYLLGALDLWIDEFHIDGLRMDAADVIDPSFWPQLRQRADGKYRPEGEMAFNGGRFWIMGEMVFGRYSDICGPDQLDSITNYELYKGLYSSHNDANYFELAWSLKRQFAEDGIYRHLKLYNFVDNHDVERITSRLNNAAHLYPLHILLFTVPGFPSLYYGSETGIPGKKEAGDWELRPELDSQRLLTSGSHPDLLHSIEKLSQIRRNEAALHDGEYSEVLVEHQQFAFLRSLGDRRVLVMVNAADEPVEVDIPAFAEDWGTLGWRDLLNADEFQSRNDGSLTVSIPAGWGRILLVETAS
jgi:cyclomaltodextrinase